MTTDLDVWMQTQQENHRLRDALLACVAVAKAWHAADDVWEIYYNHSPEMKPIREVLGALSPQLSESEQFEADQLDRDREAVLRGGYRQNKRT